MKKIICILADAFKDTYIEQYNLRFLENKLKEEKGIYYIKKIYPSTGFCEIVEYVTGKVAEENGYLAQVAFKEKWYKNVNKANFKFYLIEKIENVILKIPKFRNFYCKKLQKILDHYLVKYFSEEIVRIRYKIPITLLPYLKATESAIEYDNYNFGKKNNLFYQLKKLKKTYDLEDFVKFNKIKGSDRERLENLKNKIKNKNLKDFTLIYIGYGELAHFYTTSSEKLQHELLKFDKEIENIVRLLKENYKDYEIMILGDHGMVNVNNYINIYPIIRKISKKFKIKNKKDFIYFLDSTLLRISLKDKGLIDKISIFLKNELEGKYEEKMDSYFTNFGSEYGDIKILLKAGNVFFPDFFNSKKIKGMHGYNSLEKEQSGIFVSLSSDKNDKIIKENERLSYINKYILERFQNKNE